MLRNKPIELWINAEICVIPEGKRDWECEWERATASADTLKWSEDSSWESFDSDTATRVFYELEQAREFVRGQLAGVTVYRLLKSADEIEQVDDHEYIELGGKSVDLGDGRRLGMTFTLDIWCTD